MKKTLIALAVAAVSVAPLTANADGNQLGFYLGGSVGLTNFDAPNVPGASVDDDDTGYKFFAGYRINKFFAAEAFYADLGKASITAPSISASTSVDTFGVAALVMAPINEQFEVFGKVGVHSWDGKLRVGDPTFNDNDDGTDIMYGVGATYNLYQNISLRAEYERFEVDGDDLDFMSVGFAYNF